MAQRRDGDIAPYRNGTAKRDTSGVHGNGARTAGAILVAKENGKGIFRDKLSHLNDSGVLFCLNTEIRCVILAWHGVCS